jgi:AhpD family alkylhydroperoxidase
MKQRIDYRSAAPEGFAAMRGLEGYVRQCGLPERLLELVRMRVSQINGCAYCLDMHSNDARASGESEQRLYVLPAWREAGFYDARERAALEWAEALTRMPEGGVPDEVYERARQQFGEKELVDLTLAIIAINGWNRLAIPFRAPAGSYQRAGR